MDRSRYKVRILAAQDVGTLETLVNRFIELDLEANNGILLNVDLRPSAGYLVYALVFYTI